MYVSVAGWFGSDDLRSLFYGILGLNTRIRLAGAHYRTVPFPWYSTPYILHDLNHQVLCTPTLLGNTLTVLACTSNAVHVTDRVPLESVLVQIEYPYSKVQVHTSTCSIPYTHIVYKSHVPPSETAGMHIHTWSMRLHLVLD